MNHAQRSQDITHTQLPTIKSLQYLWYNNITTYQDLKIDVYEDRITGVGKTYV